LSVERFAFVFLRRWAQGAELCALSFQKRETLLTFHFPLLSPLCGISSLRSSTFYFCLLSFPAMLPPRQSHINKCLTSSFNLSLQRFQLYPKHIAYIFFIMFRLKRNDVTSIYFPRCSIREADLPVLLLKGDFQTRQDEEQHNLPFVRQVPQPA
jgi:hypothetical protein